MLTEQVKEVDDVLTTITAVLLIDQASYYDETGEIQLTCYGQSIFGDLYPLKLHCSYSQVREFEVAKDELQQGAVIQVKDAALNVIDDSFQLLEPTIHHYAGNAEAFRDNVAKRLAPNRIVQVTAVTDECLRGRLIEYHEYQTRSAGLMAMIRIAGMEGVQAVLFPEVNDRYRKYLVEEQELKFHGRFQSGTETPVGQRFFVVDRVVKV